MSNMLYVLNVFSCIFLKFYIHNDSIEHLGKILAYNFWDRKTELEEVKWLAYDPVVQLVMDVDPPVLNETFFFPSNILTPNNKDQDPKTAKLLTILFSSSTKFTIELGVTLNFLPVPNSFDSNIWNINPDFQDCFNVSFGNHCIILFNNNCIC